MTRLHESDEQFRLSAQVMLNLGEAVMVWDSDGKVLSVNKAHRELTGYEASKVIGQPESQFRNALQPPRFYDEMSAQLEQTGRWSGSTWTRRKNGTLYKEMRTVSAIRDEYAKVTHYVAIFFETD